MDGIHGDVMLADGKRKLADVSAAVGAVSLDYRVSASAEMSFPLVDPDGAVTRAGLLDAGDRLIFDESTFDVAAVERTQRADRIDATVTARSRLSRRLRLMDGPDAKAKITPADWITQVVRKAGGKATVQPGAKRRRIVQKRGQSVLDVIAQLSQDMSTDWVEYGDRIYVGTGWWARNGGPGLPTWPLVVGSAECLSLSTRSSLDDRNDEATATATVPVEVGRKWRPWHRLQVSKAAASGDNGIWLVTGVSFTLKDKTPASIELSRPRKSSVTKGSSSKGGQGGDVQVGAGGWIDGADRVWPGCNRTPKQFVAYATSRVGQGFRENGCLAFVSLAVRGSEGAGGYSARYVWKFAPPNTAKSPGDTSPPAGAIVVWGSGAGGGHGHIGISVGGGWMISATGGAVQRDRIATFTSDYLGAMVPNFGGNYPTYPGA